MPGSLERLRDAAIEALRGMTRNEAALSMLDTRYRWNGSSHERRLLRRGDDVALVGAGVDAVPVEPTVSRVVERLVAFQDEFSWSNALAVGRPARATAVFNLLNRLVRAGALTRLPGKRTRDA